LPEAQVDRFMLKVVVGYPSTSEERKVVDVALDGLRREVQPVLNPAQLADMQQTAASIYLDDKVKDYVLDIVSATRNPERYRLNELKPLIEYGASPRASINLCLAARANAFLVGRAYVTPQDVKDVSLDILRHRVLLTYEAEAEETTSTTSSPQGAESVPFPEAFPCLLDNLKMS
jgi:MoxR-like ATPase